jgi:hypothetical protein
MNYLGTYCSLRFDVHVGEGLLTKAVSKKRNKKNRIIPLLQRVLPPRHPSPATTPEAAKHKRNNASKE